MRTRNREATVYDTTMRSTLEARWAIFFRELGLKWRYEPERISGYLPDFHVEELGYVEIKPTLDLFIKESSDRIKKAAMENPNLKIYVFCGNVVNFNMVALYEGDKIFAPTCRQMYRIVSLARTKESLEPEVQDAFISRAMEIACQTELHSEWKTMKEVIPEVLDMILQDYQNSPSKT